MQSNTRRGIESCGVLGGVLTADSSAFTITKLILPKQKGEANTVEMTDEVGLFNYMEESSKEVRLQPLGWIHTHPTQTCFLSSIDVHTQSGYQVRTALHWCSMNSAAGSATAVHPCCGSCAGSHRRQLCTHQTENCMTICYTLTEGVVSVFIRFWIYTDQSFCWTDYLSSCVTGFRCACSLSYRRRWQLLSLPRIPVKSRRSSASQRLVAWTWCLDAQQQDFTRMLLQRMARRYMNSVDMCTWMKLHLSNVWI